MAGKVLKVYEGVEYTENFKTSAFRKIIEILFILRLKYKNEGNVYLQKLAKLLINSLHSYNNRKDINE